jgi:glycosyltransferase involved in cell wall biosynthesis
MTYTLGRLPTVSAQNPPGGQLVLICGRDPLRTSGGSESYLIGQARAAILAGYEPHVFSVGLRRETLETSFGTLHRIRSPILRPRSVFSVLQRPWLVPAVLRFLQDEPGTHVIHGFGAWGDIVLEIARAMHRRGQRAIPVTTAFMATEHETAAKLESEVVDASLWWHAVHWLELEWVRHVTVPLERRAFRAMTRLIVNYENVRRELVARYGRGMHIQRMTYTPPTAFAEPLVHQPSGSLRDFERPGPPLIVSVSRHDGRKGIEVLIGALNGLRADGVEFRACLVGPGLLLDEHRRLISGLQLQDRVEIPGRVPEVMPYLLHSDVYVLPSREECSGSVAVLEAMQAGAAIVASEVDGIPEDLTHGHDAILVPPGDPQALQAAIAQLLGDPRLRRRLGAEARRTYERRFAPEVFARQLAELYSELGLPPSEFRTVEMPGPDEAPAAAATSAQAAC